MKPWGSRRDILRILIMSKTITVQRSMSKLSGICTTNSFWVLTCLYRLLAEIRMPRGLSSRLKSMWKLRGTLETGAFTYKYRYLPVSPRLRASERGWGIWMKLLAEMLPWMHMTLRPISGASAYMTTPCFLFAFQSANGNTLKVLKTSTKGCCQTVWITVALEELVSFAL